MEATIEKIKVTRIKEWPNKLGFDATVNGVRFQVVNDRVVNLLIAIREAKVEKITHSIRIADGHGSTWIDGDQNVAILVYRIWRDHKSEWTSHKE